MAKPTCGECGHAHTMPHQCLTMIATDPATSYMNAWCDCEAKP